MATVAEMGPEAASAPTETYRKIVIERTTRRRDANGRFAFEFDVDPELVRVDYEGKDLLLIAVCKKHRISNSTLNRMVARYGWTMRAPHRIDPNDLIMRMFDAVDAQMKDLETITTDYGTTHANMLNRLVTTLDRLIEIKDADARRNRQSGKPSKEIAELRSKIAHRIAELSQS